MVGELTDGMVSVRVILGSRCALILGKTTVTVPAAGPGVQGVEADPATNPLVMVHLLNVVPAGIGIVTTTLSALVEPSFLTRIV